MHALSRIIYLEKPSMASHWHRYHAFILRVNMPDNTGPPWEVIMSSETSSFPLWHCLRTKQIFFHHTHAMLPSPYTWCRSSSTHEVVRTTSVCLKWSWQSSPTFFSVNIPSGTKQPLNMPFTYLKSMSRAMFPLIFHVSEHTHKLPEHYLDHCEQHQTCTLWPHRYHTCPKPKIIMLHGLLK